MKLSTDSEKTDPTLTNPSTDKAELHRAKLLNDKEEPIVAQLRIDIAEPKRAKLRTDKDEPQKA